MAKVIWNYENQSDTRVLELSLLSIMRHGTALLKTIWTQSDTHVLELRQSLLKTMWKSDTHVLESFGENYNYLPRFLAPNVCSSTTHSNSVLNSLTTLLSSNDIFEEQRANPQWTTVATTMNNISDNRNEQQ